MNKKLIGPLIISFSLLLSGCSSQDSAVPETVAEALTEASEEAGGENADTE